MTTKLVRPKHYEYFQPTPSSSHECRDAVCNAPAGYVDGYYLVGTRRVRVWACLKHWRGNVSSVVVTPPSVQAGIDADEKHYRQMEYTYKNGIDPNEV